ncbi:hypothetical protein KXS07_28955 [Inquilinus limosus]|uniref:hypothetical protein n=1 Tax=Inquilinus limosus TaxID=171674 RepID=UPI003F188088
MAKEKEEAERRTAELREMLKAWKMDSASIEAIHDAAKASFAEVKALTEYEDGKASRLLTIVAFLSAVVGAVFTRFATVYPWPDIRCASISAEWLLPAATHSAFLIYIVLVTWSVLSVLNAIKPTFNAPSDWKNRSTPGLPKSMLFYQLIADVMPVQWGQAFQTLSAEKERSGLKEYYAKCYIYESHLIAEKVEKKLSLLKPAIDRLRLAMAVLIAFFVLFGAVFVIVSPSHTP